ncbi:MAG: hypothetical protein JW836_07210 [Deltaproteobacteria bacterium]|nr:hypothetical protein [Deltaproteobacteria bacterium]
MGREDELLSGVSEEPSLKEIGEKIVSMPTVAYGRSGEMLDALDIQVLTGNPMGIKWVDLDTYAGFSFAGSGFTKRGEGGVFINIHKTLYADPHNLYIAISPDIDEGTLVHQLAHALDFLGGSRLLPGTLEPLAYELGIPVEHLEHPEEFAYWYEFLVHKFGVRPDADDAIISYLYGHQLLIKGAEIQGKNVFILKSKSERILQYLNDHSEEVDALIRGLPGYLGKRTQNQ